MNLAKNFLLVVFVAVSISACGTEPIEDSKKEFNHEKVANDIMADSITEEEFLAMELSDDQTFEVYKVIRDKSGLQTSDADLMNYVQKSESLENQDARLSAASTVQCTQKIEKASGTKNKVSPPQIKNPNTNECGKDLISDTVLEFARGMGPFDNPDKMRWWSDSFYMRTRISIAYPSGISANGLCSNTIRACVGIGGTILTSKNQLQSIYLWNN